MEREWSTGNYSDKKFKPNLIANINNQYIDPLMLEGVVPGYKEER